MELLLAATALFASHVAALYAAGQICHSNLECNAKCIGGKWTLRRRDNDIVLECDRLAIDATQFYYAICQTISADKRGYVANEYGGPATAKACNSVGTLSCEAGCVISGKKSVEASTRTGWERMCRSETGRGSPEILRGDSEAEASILAFCSETK